MASTNVFDLEAIRTAKSAPMNISYSSNEWNPPASQPSIGIGNGTQQPSSNLYDPTHSTQGLEGAVTSSLLNGVPNSLHPNSQIHALNTQSQSPQPTSTVPNVLPMPYGLSGNSPQANNTPSGQVENISNSRIQEPAIATHVRDNSPFPGHHIALATAGSLPVPQSTSAGIMNTPGGLRLAFEAPVTDTNTSKMAQVVVQPGTVGESEQYLPKIEGLLDELANKAADARTLFHGGQYDKCSNNLAEVKARLKAIADIGVESLATVVDYQQNKLPSHEARQPAQSTRAFDTNVQQSPKLTPEKEQRLYNAALFSGVQTSPGCKKRPISTDMLGLPAKSLRGDLAGAQPMRQGASEMSKSHSRQSSDNTPQPMFTPASNSPVFEFHPVSSQQRTLDLAAGTPSASQAQAPFFEPQVFIGNNGTDEPAQSTQALLANLKPDVAGDAQANLLPRSRGNSVSTTSTSFANTHTENTPQELPISPDPLQFAIKQHSFGQGEQWSDPKASLGESNKETATPLFHTPHETNAPEENNPLMSSIPITTGTDTNVDESWENVAQLDRAGSSELPNELRKRLDDVFHEFLNSLCSNLDATDDRGEPIHQTLMPKKMARLDESPDFRPFKFRIQAFTNAFQSELQKRGIHEGICSIKKIKQYLWTQPFISRFNEDGKKAKSKGNHIWNIEAKKLPEGGWVFRTFSPKIAGASSKVAHVNERWTWNLRIWDPQASSSSIKVVYSANTLPSWMHWEDNEKVLTGIPQSTSQSGEVSVTALYVHLGQLHRLEHSFFLQVLPQSEPTVPVPDSGRGMEAQAPRSLEPEQQATSDKRSMLPSSATNNSSMINLPLPNRGMPETPFERESIKYEVVEPSRAPDVLSSVPFPFTPPVYMDKHVQHMSLNQGILAQNPEGITPNQPYNMATNNLYAGQGMSGMPQPSPLDQTAVFVGNQALKEGSTPGAGQPLPQNLMSHDPLRATQLWNMIERRQQDQVSSLMLTIPSRRPSFSMNEHPGQGTPISNMPHDIRATLPQINHNTSSGP